jgi:hypothetical protein
MARREDERPLPAFYEEELARAHRAWRQRETGRGRVQAGAGPTRPTRPARPAMSSLSPRRRRLQGWLVGVLVLAVVAAVAMDGAGWSDPGASQPQAGGGAGVLEALVAAVVRFMNAMPAMPAMLLATVVVAFPATLVHELGHALVARRRLDTEVKVQVGTSGRIATVRLGRIGAEIHALGMPGRAAGRAVFDGSAATVLDAVLIALAGPAASLIGFVICAFAWSATSDGIVGDLLWAATLECAFGSLVNLVPMSVHEHGGRVLRTDGRAVLDAMRIARATVPSSTAAPRAVTRRPARAPLKPAAPSPVAHEPLRGRNGAPLGVEPLPRMGQPNPADDGLTRRAQRLAANKSRSVPPPGG